jgi:ABC-2 type transport system permease protein
MLTPLTAMIRKDLLLFLTDRRAVILTLIAPIVIASFFGFIFSGGGSAKAPAKITIAIADEDGSAVSKAIVMGAQTDRNLQVDMLSAALASEQVRKGAISVAVVIPKGFGDAAARAFFSAQNRPRLAFLYDPSHLGEMGMVSGILTQYVMESVSAEVFSGSNDSTRIAEDSIEASSLPPDQREKLRELIHAAQSFYSVTPLPGPEGTSADAHPARGIGMPYTVEERAVTSGTNVAYNGYAHAFAGMTIQFILIAAVDLGIGILTERQRGLWKRLRSAPISRRLLLAGKTVSASLLGLLSLVVCFAFAMAVFGVRIHGSIAGFALVATASAFMAASFGILIAAIGRTPQAVRGVSMLAVLVMLMLGGAWMPSFMFPQWLQELSFVIPTRWAIDGLEAMTWRGLDLGTAVTSAAALSGFAVVFLGIAVWRFRWEE